jgi:tRNA pseudouridine55 synthase
MDGFLYIDKPAGITSHDVIDRLRRLTGVRRIGHAGTLDPFATGLLVVGVGREATKKLGGFLGQDKEYVGTMVLGGRSDTQDATGRITPESVAAMPDRTSLEAAVRKFVGQISQTPPMYSAKKIRGQKLYELARQGKEIAREPVTVTVSEMELTGYEPPKATFRVRCSSGTYIRTLAHDIGDVLKTGAYLESLRRTAIGDISIEKSIKLEELTPENWQRHLLPKI